ncbi:MAG: DUF805 domain-containing protein [Acidimicrobiales bacterium]
MGIVTGQGRVGRLGYFATNLAIGAILFVLGYASLDVDDFTGQARLDPLFLVALAVGVWASYGNMIRRLHDRGLPGWWVLLSVVPFVNWALGLYLLFAPGDPINNRYGPPPGKTVAYSVEAQRDRVDAIAAAAGRAYQARNAAYLNEDGSFNMNGLTTSTGGAPAPSGPCDGPDPRWAPPSGPPSR